MSGLRDHISVDFLWQNFLKQDYMYIWIESESMVVLSDDDACRGPQKQEISCQLNNCSA